MNRFLCSIIALVSLSLSFPVASESEVGAHRVLSAAYVDFPPLTYTDDNGNPTGYYIKLSEQIAASAGYSLNWQQLPLGRVYQFLESGEVDFWAGIGGLPNLREAVVESTVPIGELTLAAYHLDKTDPVESFDDLAGKSLIFLAGYTYLGAMDHLVDDGTTEIHTTPGHKSGVQMLALGRGDYLLAYVEPMAEVLKEMPVAGLERSELMTSRLAFVVSQRTPGHQEIMARLEAELTPGIASVGHRTAE